jgi:hypothetical protein
MARDLKNTLSDSVLTAISGYDASTDKEMFNNYPTLSAMTRNTDNWMYGLSGSTGIPPLNNRTLGGYVDGTILGGALITPRHAVFALHASAQVGNIFYFWDRDNNVYTRTVSGTAATG